jgi:uncharacterized protein (DUF1501 family)
MIRLDADRPATFCDGLTRRDFLHAGAIAPLGLTLTEFNRAKAAANARDSDVNCIMLFLVGGPSQLDTFDPKPDAPSDVRGPFAAVPTRVPGVYLSELFPKLAGLADRFSLIRSMHHTAPPIHEAGLQLNNTGRLFRDGPAWPNVRSVLAYLHGDGPADPLGRRGYVAPYPDVETGVSVDKGFGPGFLVGRVATQTCGKNMAGDEMAAHFLATGRGDPRYGPSAFAQNLWRAANSVEKEPGRFVTVNQFSTVFDAPSWDCHADRGSLATTLADYRGTVAPGFDAAFAALLTDLEDRGLLDTTLVVAVGEFGRTPRLNANGGRDHWAGCWTALVAGGGVRGGRVVGRSDATASEPADRPVTPQELVATVFHALGVPAAATIPGPDGAPAAVYPARPVAELF